MAQAVGQEAFAIVAGDIGGGNGVEAVNVAAAMNLPIVDADSWEEPSLNCRYSQHASGLQLWSHLTLSRNSLPWLDSDTCSIVGVTCKSERVMHHDCSLLLACATVLPLLGEDTIPRDTICFPNNYPETEGCPAVTRHRLLRWFADDDNINLWGAYSAGSTG